MAELLRGHISDTDLLRELEPTAERLLERHLQNTKEWYPHELIPYDEARTFTPEYEWSPNEYPIDPAARSALYVNLLTEDNLPYYSRDVELITGGEGAWGEWSRRWTAEEGRHSIVIREYMTARRIVDPRELERARMAQVSGGVVPDQPSTRRGKLYVSLQEPATRVAHSNTGRLLLDKAGRRIMATVASDENLHGIFYQDVAEAGFQIDPSGFMKDLLVVIKNFKMPGTGIIGFKEHSQRIAAAGIYGVTEFHGSVLKPVLDRWGVFDMTGLDDGAKKAQEGVHKYLEILKKAAAGERRRREAYRAALDETGNEPTDL